ncbi:MAG: chemotaxis protein CheW [Candidatus Riflebacteria bacterium]|nr:chemotaxis protein CheW [Candidatus Riflebacteria bacterium]
MNRDEGRDCWSTRGVQGDRSCPELARHIHCHNCPVFARGAAMLLEQPPPDGYREEWAAALSAAKETGPRRDGVISIFRIDSEWLALPASCIVEVAPIGPVRRVPHQSGEVLHGLAIVRGEVRLCFSMGALVGLPGRGPGDEKPATGDLRPGSRVCPRFCVIRTRGGPWVFTADEVWGVTPYATSEIRPVPVTVAKATPQFTSGVLARDGREIGILDEELVTCALERSLE